MSDTERTMSYLRGRSDSAGWARIAALEAERDALRVTLSARDEAVEALRALSEAATPGPWMQPENADGDGLYAGVWAESAGEYVVEPNDPLDMQQAIRDAAFIAAAANLVRAALAPPSPGDGEPGE